MAKGLERDKGVRSLEARFHEWSGVRTIPAKKQGTFVGIEIGFIDLETTGLNGSVHQIICACIADSFGNVKTLHRKEKRFYTGDPMDDSKLAKEIRDEFEKYDLLVGWNTSGFDLPFLNARLMVAGMKPVRSDVMHKDIMWAYGGKSRWSARAGRKSLQNISEFFKTSNQKEVLTWEIWERARAGDGKAEALIVSHCQADVLTLRDVYAFTKPLLLNYHR